jgi:hypothetical protein
MVPVNTQRIRVAVVTVGLALGVAACSSSTSSSTTTAKTTTTTIAVSSTAPGPVGSASSDLCQAREALKTSITGLSSVDIVKNGTSGLTDALNTIKTNLQAVRAAAGSDVQPQVDAFQKSLDALQTALGGGAPAATVTAVRDVGTTGATLLTSLENLKCS